ncbi:hypothetical protein RchiOBHm_Chr5g0045471 [Rosa chinensis]|uniref:Uncharacterized protein n=1 Tax=Rosa chinensis TaxID=74649 RepID=A0A2P6QDW8_ROSCH|nr:hypothetical protein RchiOBHm_Chr5g0045471 [Rosa chinensis]
MIFADYLLVILLRSCGGDFGRPKCQARSRFAFGGLVTTCFPQEKGYSLKGIWGMFIAFYSIMGEKTLLTYSVSVLLLLSYSLLHLLICITLYCPT